MFAGCLLTVQCHMPGRANSLALAEANISFTSCFCMHCRAGLMKSFHTTALYRTCDLFSPMNCHAALCTVRFIYSTILHSTCNLFSPTCNCHAALCTVRFIYSFAIQYCTQPVTCFPSSTVMLPFAHSEIYLQHNTALNL